MNFVALTLAVGAVAVSTLAAGLSALPNSANINSLSQEVATLKASNKRLEQQLEVAIQNRSRIDELDVGLLAIATVLKIDRQELANAMAAAKGEDVAVTTLENGDSGAIAVTAATAVIDKPQTQTASALNQGEASSSEAIADSQAPTPNREPIELAVALGSDNPFAAASEPVESPTALSVSVAPDPAPVRPVSIAQVDGVLAKRISENWYKPAGAAENLSAIVQLKMQRDGKVASVKLTKASGDAAFDNSAINAINSIGFIDEVQQLSDADFQKGYASRSIQFTPQMGG